VAVAEHLGLALDAPGFASWDVHEATETPGELVLQTSWRDPAAAQAYAALVDLRDGPGCEACA
jgi:quinol monooxygenase YgiN